MTPTNWLLLILVSVWSVSEAFLIYFITHLSLNQVMSLSTFPKFEHFSNELIKDMFRVYNQLKISESKIFVLFGVLSIFSRILIGLGIFGWSLNTFELDIHFRLTLGLGLTWLLGTPVLLFVRNRIFVDKFLLLSLILLEQFLYLGWVGCLLALATKAGLIFLPSDLTILILVSYYVCLAIPDHLNRFVQRRFNKVQTLNINLNIALYQLLSSNREDQSLYPIYDYWYSILLYFALIEYYIDRDKYYWDEIAIEYETVVNSVNEYLVRLQKQKPQNIEISRLISLIEDLKHLAYFICERRKDESHEHLKTISANLLIRRYS